MLDARFLIYALVAIIGYFIGSISPGILLSKKVANIDIREYGSKSSGATNVLRVMGTHMGLSVFLLDILKAIISCLIGIYVMAAFDPNLSRYGGMLAGLFTVIGHNWPIFHGFKGGKGVACSGAIIVWMFPVEGLIAVAICIAIIALTKYVSLGSMSMLVVFEIIILIKYMPSNLIYCIWGFILMVLCIYRHKSNVKRLINGTENKLGKKVNAKDKEK